MLDYELSNGTGFLQLITRDGDYEYHFNTVYSVNGSYGKDIIKDSILDVKLLNVKNMYDKTVDVTKPEMIL